jgi:hypothetical protein
MVCENSQLHAAVEAVSMRTGEMAHLRRVLLTKCSLSVPGQK